MALSISGTVNDNQAGILRPRKTATPLIINGDMQIAQRGTSATAIGNTDSGYHVCDRWRFSEQGDPTGEFTISQSTDVPTGQGFVNSLKFDVTTSDTLLSSEFFRFEYRSEAQDMKVLKYGTSSAETTTLSFWVKSNKTGDYAISIRQSDDNRSLTKTYTINSANTWEKKIINIPADTTGVIDNDNGIGLHFYWYFDAGSDYTGTTQTTWGSYADGMTANGHAVTLLDSTDNDWYITGVQLEVGTFDSNSIPDFQFEDRATSLARCQRYYMKIGGNPSDDNVFGSGYAHTTTSIRFVTHFPASLRAPATAIETNGVASNYRILGGGASAKNSSAVPTFGACGLNSARSTATVSSGLSQYSGCIVDAGTDNAVFLAWDSEL